MMLSISTVAKDDFPRLVKTATSVAKQTSTAKIHHHIQLCNSDDYTISFLKQLQRVSPPSYVMTFAVEADTGIYDAMNKSLKHLKGQYVLFLNCGDKLISRHSAMQLHALLTALLDSSSAESLPVLISLAFRYGFGNYKYDIVGYSGFRAAIKSGFPICQQSLLYSRKYLSEHAFNSKFRYAADYEHALSIAGSNLNVLDLPYALADYEPGGVSETESQSVLQEIRLINESSGDWG